MYCVYCGSKVEEGQSFCTQCGKKLTEQEATGDPGYRMKKAYGKESL